MNIKSKFVACLCLLATSAFAVDTITVGQLEKAVDKYDGKQITVSGVVDKFEQRTSKAGNPYVTATLLDKADKKQTLSLYARGKIERELKKGDYVEVTGTYTKVKKVGTLTFKNEIEAKLESIKIKSGK
jgi:DNA polymerase III alpha subunit